jgi:hypothetical protein
MIRDSSQGESKDSGVWRCHVVGLCVESVWVMLSRVRIKRLMSQLGVLIAHSWELYYDK